MAYGELIKKFEKIREYMREFFVYGFKNRDKVGTKSARSYDNERRRIESWLGDSMTFLHSANGKAHFISVDTRKVPSNPLYHAFKAICLKEHTFRTLCWQQRFCSMAETSEKGWGREKHLENFLHI